MTAWPLFDRLLWPCPLLFLQHVRPCFYPHCNRHGDAKVMVNFDFINPICSNLCFGSADPVSRPLLDEGAGTINL